MIVQNLMETKSDKKLQQIYKKSGAILMQYKQNPQQIQISKNQQLISRKNTYSNIRSKQLFLRRHRSEQELKKRFIYEKVAQVTNNFRQPVLRADISKLATEKNFGQKYNKMKRKSSHLEIETEASSFENLHESKKIFPNFIKPQLTKRQSKPIISKLDIDSFKIIRKLGFGKFGQVYMVKQKQTGFICAMKVIEKQKISKNGLKQFIRQLKIQSYLNHSNIIQIYGIFHDQQLFYVLMELGNDGNLYSLLKSKNKFTEESTSFVSRSLLEAAGYLHLQGIIHRDIKLENVVLSLGCVKICDFGWAVIKNKQQLRKTYCGTPLYLSPQILINEGYDQKVDLWAIGILTYQLMIGQPPFNIKFKTDLNLILTQHIQFPSAIKNCNKQFVHFIQTILSKNPDQRESSNKLLQFKFIKKYQDLQICVQLCN